MADVVVAIAPKQGTTAPAGALPASVPVELVFQRDVGTDDAGQPLEPIQDVARGAIGTDFTGTLTLPSAVAGTDVEVRFLSGSGIPKHVIRTTLPAGGGSLSIDLAVADFAAIAAAEPRPPDPPKYVRRDAQLVPAGADAIPFARCNLVVAAVTVSGNGWKQLGLDKLFNLSSAATTAVESDGSTWAQRDVPGWTPEHIAVDGRLTTFFPEGQRRDAWMWWLTGPLSVIGIVQDDLAKEGAGVASIVLPPLSAPPVAGGGSTGDGRVVPADVTEREVAENPDIYTEDPGAFCKPFSNPERVLGERSFNVIYRAEQPVLSAEASIRTVSPPLLDFDLPDLVDREAEGDRGRSVRERVVDRLRMGARTTVAAAARTVRFPALAPFVIRDDLPQVLIDDWRRGDRGRRPVDAQHPVQWDADSSRYQAVTVARGHILEFRMRWRSNGYSLGTVAKTLTLAPRQVKRIQKIEWQRLERTRREERTEFVERAADSVTRERQYDDAVQASLAEWARGESESSSTAGAGGFGFATGGFVIGGGGGHSNASSSSSQEGGRRVTASEEQRLRDTVRRYGDSLRRLESVVVNEVTQEETVTGTAEVVRNANYGHALTVIYYQILRHLKIETAFAAVRECLFVPFAIKPFTIARTYRWRDLIQRGLLNRQFAPALRYLKDVLTGFAGSTVPPGRRSDQRIRHISGSLYLTLGVARPRDTAEGAFDQAAWLVIHPFLGTPAQGIFALLQQQAEARRDRVFQEEHAPGIAAGWVNTIGITAGVPLVTDMTLATRYTFNGTVRVDFSASTAGAFVTREMLSSIRARASRNLPPGSVANVTRLTITYQTDQFERTFSVTPGAQDLVQPETGVRDAGGSIFASIPDTWERQDVRAEMIRAVTELVGHLNEHAEHYHKAIWWNMDRDRLFMLVDGFEVPGAGGASIGSVIERDPIAIMGNALVFRVSAGSFLGLADLDDPVKLHNYYAARKPISDPMLVSLPTDGLYAQTIMDECEALEEHNGSTDWILEQADPELPTIGSELLASRRAEPGAATPTPFPQTLINLQNAGEAPAPSGLAGAFGAVTSPNAFRDMAGLAGTQANAAAALQTAAGLATTFGQQAAALKMAELAADAQAAKQADQKLATVQRAVQKELVSPEVGTAEAEKILQELHAPPTPPPHEDRGIAGAITAAAGTPGSTIEATTPDGQVRVMLAQAQLGPTTQQCGFFNLAGAALGESAVRAAVVDAAVAEQSLWQAANGNLLRESRASQFGFLLRYWLTERQQVTAFDLITIGNTAADPTTNYRRLTNTGNVTEANLNADARLVATDLLAGIPTPTTPTDLRTLIAAAALDARKSKRDALAWSGVFINTAVRNAEFNLNMESPAGGSEALLKLSRHGRHWEYTLHAHRRRFGCSLPGGAFDANCQQDGTYHAFRTTERVIQEGDIIVVDRQAAQLANVWAFDRIPDLATARREMHGDIVVDVQPGFAETIGGNVGNSVRRRRYPLDANGMLVVAENQLWAQESDAHVFPVLPINTAAQLDGESTGRIFAVLSPVAACRAIPAPTPAPQPEPFMQA